MRHILLLLMLLGLVGLENGCERKKEAAMPSGQWKLRVEHEGAVVPGAKIAWGEATYVDGTLTVRCGDSAPVQLTDRTKIARLHDLVVHTNWQEAMDQEKPAVPGTRPARVRVEIGGKIYQVSRQPLDEEFLRLCW